MHDENLNTDNRILQAVPSASLPRSCFSCLVAPSCPALCNPMDCSLSGSSVYGISQARIQERKKVKSLSRVQFFATPWTVAYQAPLSMGFSRQEYWNGLPFPSPGDLPDPGIEPGFPPLQADTLLSEPQGSPSTCYRVWAKKWKKKKKV